MKSKKKLIYKLHQNFNQNPYKIPDQLSFRNAGVRPYDFNKLRSIRAISLRGESSQFQMKRNLDERMVYNTNKLATYEDRDRMIQQRLMGYEKRTKVDEKADGDRIAQQKKIQDYQQDSHKNMLPQTIIKRSQSIKPSRFMQDKHLQANNFQHNMIQNTAGHKVSLQKCETRPKNAAKHQRNVSLPVINSHFQSEPINKTVNIVNKREYMLTFVEEQKAKDLVLKQLGVKNSLSKFTSTNQNSTNKQQKINSQVLASIKLKSVDNLQRLARSRSQVVIIDKWKEKYGQQSKHQTKKSNEVMGQNVVEKSLTKNVEKTILPKLKTIQMYDDQQEIKDQKVDQVMQENKKDLKIEKKQNSGESQQIYTARYQDLDTKKEYQSVQIIPAQSVSEKKHIFCLNHYLSKENPNTQRQKDSIPMMKQEFLSGQPLKITVTQVKKHQRKNKQNLNQQNTRIHKVSFNSIQRLQKVQKKSISPYQSQEVLQKAIQDNHKASTELKKEKLNEQNSQIQKSNQKIKTFFSFKNLKVNNDKKQDQLKSSKSRQKIKLKVNQQKVFMQKIIENDAMIEWQNKLYADMQQFEFHAFVKQRANEMNED